MFSSHSSLRIFLKKLISNPYFDGMIYHCIAFNSLMLALDEPRLTDGYQRATISLILNLISIVFVCEMIIKIIAMGFYFGENTYFKDNWNRLDFIIVMFSFLTWFLEALFDSDLSFIVAFRALRALRPLRAVSKNEGKFFFLTKYNL